MATTVITATNSSYIMLRTGPVIIEPRADIRVFFGTSLPVVGIDTFHYIKGGHSFSYGGTENSYVLSALTSTAKVIST